MIVELIDRQAVLDAIDELTKIAEKQDGSQAVKALTLIPLRYMKEYVDNIPTQTLEIRHNRYKIKGRT